MAIISSITRSARRLSYGALSASSRGWTSYRALRPRYQWVIGIAAILLIVALFTFLRSGSANESADTLRSVSLETVGALSGGEDGSATLFGSVKSITEANVVAKTSGTITAVRSQVGATVGAGAILASMENAAESAAVLSAQGSYEAALAARSITTLESGDAEVSARNTFRSQFTSIESALENYADPLFTGAERVNGLTLNQEEDRKAIQVRLTDWRRELSTADSKDPLTLLRDAEVTAVMASEFITDIARTVNGPNSNATATQRAGIATGRATIDASRSAIASARTNVEVARNRTGSGSGQTASADASVKQALGALRSAEANFERTVIRAPIAGTVNFLPVKVGDYVAAMTHVATVARNGALEITAYVSEEDAGSLSVGDSVIIDEDAKGTITFISPALDPVNKQIEVRVAASAGVELLSGQSVRVRLASAPKTEAPTGPVMLPLSAVKLTTGSRIVFSVGEDMRLIANPVEVGDVRGDRIEIISELPLELRIVKDARGLSAGQEVKVTAAN